MATFLPPTGLIAALGLASVGYLFERRDGHIPNGLTLPAIALGLAYGVVERDALSHLASLALFAVPLLALFRARLLGAGGVKLIAAAATFAGLPAAIPLGGALALLVGGGYLAARVQPKKFRHLRVLGSLFLLAGVVVAIAFDVGLRVVNH